MTGLHRIQGEIIEYALATDTQTCKMAAGELYHSSCRVEKLVLIYDPAGLGFDLGLILPESVEMRYYTATQ